MEAAGHRYRDASCLYTLSIQDSTGGHLSADRRAHAQRYFCDMAWVQLWLIHLQAQSCIQKKKKKNPPRAATTVGKHEHIFIFLSRHRSLSPLRCVANFHAESHCTLASFCSFYFSSFLCLLSSLSEYLGLSLSLPSLPENFLPPSVQIYNHLVVTRRLPLSAPLSLLSLYV